MRRIERQPEPAFMRSREFLAAQEEWRRFHLSGGAREHQVRLQVNRLLDPFRDQIDAALDTQFHGRCAYTEVSRIGTPPTPGQPPIDHTANLGLLWHRPTADAISPDGIVSAEHYWWLALEWDNWYLASDHVQSVKLNQFPVTGTRSAPPSGSDDRGPLDEGILLDPCRDHPSLSLRFEVDGTVTPRRLHPEVATLLGTTASRGVGTIRILGLNDPRLVDARSELIRFSSLLRTPRRSAAATQVAVRSERRGGTAAGRLAEQRQLEQILSRAPDIVVGELLDAAANWSDLTTPVIDIVGEWIAAELPQLVDTEWFRRLTGGGERRGEAHARDEATDPLDASPQNAESFDSPATSVQIHATDRITSIRIRNFRAIKSIELDIDSDPITLPARYGRPDEHPVNASRWTMLLGENGSGKSSILQAIALALSGPQLDDVLANADLEWGDILRRGTDDDAPTRGQVRLAFTSGQTIDLRFSNKSGWFQGLDGGSPTMHVNVRGYGATRLLGTSNVDVSPTEDVTSTQVANLFDPSVYVTDAKAWLCSLDGDRTAGAFATAAITLADLLGIPSSVDARTSATPRIMRNADKTDVFVDGDRLSDVSDGYRSVIAIACDIMAGIGGLHLPGGGFGDLANARGIVLIDEIGAHLHPSWRMEITDRLRRSLPNVQFIATTHEPLCLRGLYEREVVRVLKYVEHGVVLDVIDKAPARYRVDQLLTSEFFGLDSAIDPEVDARFQRYYDLRRRPSLTVDEQRELADLNRVLNQRLRPVLGYTRRDQLIYEAIDEFLSQQGSLDPDVRRERRKQTIQRVRDLWTQLDRTMSGGGE